MSKTTTNQSSQWQIVWQMLRDVTDFLPCSLGEGCSACFWRLGLFTSDFFRGDCLDSHVYHKRRFLSSLTQAHADFSVFKVRKTG
jgi:hypothetical protein